MRYIYEHRQELLLSKKYSPYQVSEIALEAFYKFADTQVPECLTWWTMDTALEELDFDEKSLIRSILYNHVHKTLRDNFKIVQTDDLGKIAIDQRISLCLENDLWPWIRKQQETNGNGNKNGDFYIDTSIMEIFSYRLPNLTFKKLSEITQFEYTKDRWGKNLIRCSKAKLMDFISGKEEEEQQHENQKQLNKMKNKKQQNKEIAGA
jgi:hypothetical protein